MGAVLAKFRKEKTTYEILEKLEEDIKEIEDYSISTQAQQKRYVGSFLVISIGLYVIGFLVFYFLFFPPTWMERLTYSIPLLIFPMIIFLVKRLVAWYFQRKLNKNNTKLKKLHEEKKKIIEKVMDKETYKVALEILNRFADKTNGFKPTGAVTPRIVSPVGQQLQLQQQQQQQQQQLQQKSAKQLSTSAMQLSQLQTSPITSRLSAQQLPSNTLGTAQQISSSSPMTSFIMNQNLQVPRVRTPYPIINQQGKGVLEKMADYLIGDGPSNRFAMICKECFAHNGMALQEEYEYAAFRCAFCNAMNPSRKTRPIAPKLLTSSPGHIAALPDAAVAAAAAAAAAALKRSDSSSSSSTAEKDSGSDSEKDEKEVKEVKETVDIPTEDIGTEKQDEEVSKMKKTEEEKKND